MLTHSHIEEFKLPTLLTPFVSIARTVPSENMQLVQSSCEHEQVASPPMQLLPFDIRLQFFERLWHDPGHVL